MSDRRGRFHFRLVKSMFIQDGEAEAPPGPNWLSNWRANANAWAANCTPEWARCWPPSGACRKSVRSYLPDPLSLDELDRIVAIWADACLQLSDRDLKVMQRLVAAPGSSRAGVVAAILPSRRAARPATDGAVGGPGDTGEGNLAKFLESYQCFRPLLTVRLAYAIFSP